MTDEKALIEALQASPDDDDLRLIYADWLEERADPRADYFRLVAELAARSHQSDGYAALQSQLYELAKNTDQGWREKVGKRFHLVLISVGDRKIATIKNIRAATGLGLYDSKVLVESTLPALVKGFLLREGAELLRWELEVGYTLSADGQKRPNSERYCTAAIVEPGYPLPPTELT